MREFKFDRDLAKLEEARRRTHERLQKQQERVDARFDRMQQHLERKFGKPSVTQQRIVEAALELLQEDGLESLTQRKLASKLDVQAPALYWHFKNKEELVDYMAEAILAQEFQELEPRHGEQSWQDWLIENMVRLRRAMLMYPDGARVVAGARLYPAVTLAQLLETGLVSLHSAGVDLTTARHIITTATTYTFGYVIEEQAAPTAEEMATFDIEAFLEPYPNLARSLTNEDHSPQAQNEDYLTGLRWVVQGASANLG